MALFNASDGVIDVQITSVGIIALDSPTLRLFLDAVYDVHAITPYGELNVTTTAVDEYEVVWDTLDGRQLVQRIRNPGFTGWRFRQQQQSDFFTLTEILAHNFARSALQDLIDTYAVTQVQLDF